MDNFYDVTFTCLQVIISELVVLWQGVGQDLEIGCPNLLLLHEMTV